jgi:4-diphosphocytidyl-2-C-methyl-D-erythritol kinase
MTSALAPAKINLGLVVGPLRADGKHELVTVYQRVTLADEIELEPSDRLRVEGFTEDTLVSDALGALAAEARVAPAWRVRLEKRIPVAAGLGGGSSDAATALRLANATLPEPLTARRLHSLAGALGADVPFFLADGPHLGEGDGTDLTPIDLPQGYAVLLLLPHDVAKKSTAVVYAEFDGRQGALGFDERRSALLEAVSRVERSEDLSRLPCNDLAGSALSARLTEQGAFRADVTGAGPAVYGLFEDERQAAAAASELSSLGRTVVTTACC